MVASTSKLFILAHIVSPWKWRNYYSQDWIQAVNQSHTYYTAELRHDDGVFSTQIELLPRTFHHKKRDLAILHIEDEHAACEIFQSLEADALHLDPQPFSESERFLFFGHEVQGPVAVDGPDLRRPIPRTTLGQFQVATAHQTFAKTGRLLTDGMCGGPICHTVDHPNTRVDFHNNKAGSPLTFSERYIVRGLTEGIVPQDHENENFRGLASMIPASDILDFVNEVERGEAECLEGGEAALHVGMNSDPSKVNVESLAMADKDEAAEKRKKRR